MLLLDVTVVAVALSNIQADFGSDLGSLQWVVDAYTLPLAGLLLTAATLGDRIGRRKIFLAGMALFTLGSLACALAWSPVILDLTRAAQGIGGALLFGVGLPMVGAAFPEAKARAAAIGAFGATLAGATAVGPLVGGALVDGPGWRWIFLINVPIGVAALVAGWLRLAESRVASARAADWPGTALLTAGLLALLLALIRGNADGWRSATILGLFAVAAVLLAGFVVREASAAEPMLDLRLFRSASFTGVSLGAWAVSATLVGATSYLGLYLVNTLDYSPFQAGLRFLPLTVASFVAAPIVARLVDRVPPRVTVGGGLALSAIGMMLAGQLHGDSRWTALLAGFVVAGLGLGMANASMSQAALSAVDHTRAGMATGTVNTMRQIGVAAGVAVLGAVFQHRATGDMTRQLNSARVPHAQASAIADAVGSGAGIRVADAAPAALRPALAAAARAATASALNEILIGGAIVCGIAALVALIVVRPAPSPAAVAPAAPAGSHPDAETGPSRVAAEAATPDAVAGERSRSRVAAEASTSDAVRAGAEN
jgi:EmrB/QacA subfamily drug resistance transporter